ncbi:hypothetical protein [Dictyobacter alpinus]|uniref:hypothetical protein n=1 Tax=Dictyobacter alpinus TaxID=2014873 RepID=UPI000F849976|nr:hypothetical protein [Dictyobacter alpinus]
MAGILSATGTQKPAHFVSIVMQLILFVASLAVLGILIIVVGVVLVFVALVSIVFLILAGLFLGVLILVFKVCSALFCQILRIGKHSTTAAYARISASNRYQHILKPWLVEALKRLLRWLIPFLLWQLWQWAAPTAGAAAPWAQQRPRHSLSG